MSKFGDMIIEICELRQMGFSIIDIADMFDIPKYDVSKILKEHYSYVIGES